jgi:hypothetical protein
MEPPRKATWPRFSFWNRIREFSSVPRFTTFGSPIAETVREERIAAVTKDRRNFMAGSLRVRSA